MMVRLVLALLLIAGTATCATAQRGEWQSTHYRDHLLAGILYLPGLKKPADFSKKGQLFIQQFLLDFTASARFVLIGEQHDNPDHHRIQAWLIGEMTKRGRKPSVVMEMIPNSYAAKASHYDLSTDPKLDTFAKRLDWEKRGWYSWDIYRPVVLAAAQSGLRMFPGNLDRDQTKALSKKGVSVLSPNERERYRIEDKLPPSMISELHTDLNESHCGMLPESALPSMSVVQRVRDGVMADALIQSGQRDGGVLIAGNGHVRKDRGVPFIVKKLLPGHDEVKLEKNGETRLIRTPRSQNVAIGLIEVQPGLEDPRKYRLNNSEGTALYDVVMFTPKFDITDHCAALREQFNSSKKKQP